MSEEIEERRRVLTNIYFIIKNLKVEENTEGKVMGKKQLDRRRKNNIWSEGDLGGKIDSDMNL